jgi:hypothetical protein
MTAKVLARMRKYWPITVTVAYLLCHGLIYLVGWLSNLPPETPRHFRNGPDIPGAVLFGAAFLGTRFACLARAGWVRILGSAVVVLAILGQGWRIYSHLETAKSASLLAEIEVEGDKRISRIPAAALRPNDGVHLHSGRIAAQFYFEKTGLTIPYRDESNEVRMFEPNAKAIALRDGAIEGREMLEKSRPMFRAYASTFRWVGYSELFIAAVSIFGSLGLFLSRKDRALILSTEAIQANP